MHICTGALEKKESFTVKTYISLASSATMFPVSGTILTSPLTPELIKARLAYPDLITSTLNPSHATTIDVIQRRYGLTLPLPVLAPGQRAPQVKLGPGDELFIVQATLPRLSEGEVHSDETVQSAPISFLRWRVPVHVGIIAPYGIPQTVFDQAIDHAYSIALWRRGATKLKGAGEIATDLDGEIKELQEATENMGRLYAEGKEFAREGRNAYADLLLEAGDVLYKGLCAHYVLNGNKKSDDELFYTAKHALRSLVPMDTVQDAMLLKYARRAAGLPKDQQAERALLAAHLPQLTVVE